MTLRRFWPVLAGTVAWVASGPAAHAGTATAAGAAAAPPAYVDRVLDDSPQAPETAADALESGWPRGWSAELQSTRQTGPVSTSNQTLLLNGYVDTPDYGTLSANVGLSRYSNPVTGTALYGSLGTPIAAVPYTLQGGTTWRVDQRGMPFNGGWFANNSVGDINMPAVPLARGVSRVYLPALPIEGVSTTIEQPGHTSFNASAGRLGYFSGLDYQGFATGRGSAVGAGAQTRLTGGDTPQSLGRTDVAVQAIDARHVDLNGVSGFSQDTRAIWAGASWQGVAPWAESVGPGYGSIGERLGGLKVQANVAHSTSQPSDAQSRAPRETATGTWVDATWRTQLMQQSASAFYFQPGLRWGAYNLPSDLRGVSWRGDFATRQWQLGFNTELSDSMSGLQRKSLYSSVFGRWRFDSRDAVSGNVAARTGGFAAQSAQVTWEHRSDWGYSQLRTDFARSRGLDVVRSGVDHSWLVGETRTLSTSLAVEQSSQAGATSRGLHWGVLGSTPVIGGGRLDASLRGSTGRANGAGNAGNYAGYTGYAGYADSSGPLNTYGYGSSYGYSTAASDSSRFLSANVRLSFPIGHGWSFITQYTASRGRESLNPAVISALSSAVQTPQLVSPSVRTFLLALRYEDRAGVTSAPIGGAPGVGAGRLEGHVFLDQDRNGEREASEGGATGVTVVVDGRYVARTDSRGFYSFGAVAAGPHRVELIQDNLPLPWSSPGETATRSIDIFVRDTLVIDFPVQQMR